MIKDEYNGIFFKEQLLKTIRVRESYIAQFLEKTIKEYNNKNNFDLYLKTHAKNPNSNIPKMNIYVSVKGDDEKKVTMIFNNILNKIKREINRLKGEIL